MKKKTFLLLEILIAILVSSICLIPLILSPIQSYRTEMRLLEEMEGERLADWAFSEIKEKLLKNEIAWEKLPVFRTTVGPFSLPNTSIEIPGYATKTIQRSFTLYGTSKERQGIKGEIYRMLQVNIEFTPPLCLKILKNGKKTPKKYDYTILVRQVLDEKESGKKI